MFLREITHTINAFNAVSYTHLLLNGYVWLENADTLTKDEATEILSQISEETGLNNWTVSLSLIHI